MIKNKLYNIIIDSDTKHGRRFDIFIQVLILLSITSFSLETLPEIDEEFLGYLNVFETISVIIFSIEYLLRLILTKSSIRYMFSFFGVIDLIAILPFYLSTGIDLRSIRLFRMLRLFKILKLAKYNKAISNMTTALNNIKKELLVFFIVTLCLLYVSAVGIYYFENPSQPEQFKSVFHSLWWSVTTLTTVGYGDMYPITVGGKIFSAIIIFIGLGVVAVPTGLLASALTKSINKKTDKK
jgi:voltage-gated potassium channel